MQEPFSHWCRRARAFFWLECKIPMFLHGIVNNFSGGAICRPDQNISPSKNTFPLSHFKRIIITEKKMETDIIHPHCAGIDIGSRSHLVAVGHGVENVKEFDVNADNLTAN